MKKSGALKHGGYQVDAATGGPGGPGGRAR